MHKYIGLILYFIVALTIADDNEKAVATCPEVAVCKPSDGPKKNKYYARINQSAYDCYRNLGETDLAQKAATATTKCLAVYGSTTATINGEAIIDSNNPK